LFQRFDKNPLKRFLGMLDKKTVMRILRDEGLTGENVADLVGIGRQRLYAGLNRNVVKYTKRIIDALRENARDTIADQLEHLLGNQQGPIVGKLANVVLFVKETRGLIDALRSYNYQKMASLTVIFGEGDALPPHEVCVWLFEEYVPKTVDLTVYRANLYYQR
jgi:hypothetical protein